jgi:hypothetical protein
VGFIIKSREVQNQLMLDIIQLKNFIIIFTFQNTKIISLLVTLYGRKTQSLTLRNEHKSQPLEDRMQGKYLDLKLAGIQIVVINVNILSEQYELRSSSLCNFLHFSVSLFVCRGSNILLGILLLNISCLFSGQQTKIHSKVLATAQTFETLMCNPL